MEEILHQTVIPLESHYLECFIVLNSYQLISYWPIDIPLVIVHYFPTIIESRGGILGAYSFKLLRRLGNDNPY